MRLSIIICTRNRAFALTDCLNSLAASVVNAGLKDAEIVVVNNASTDNTAEVVNAWAATSPVPVQLVLETRKGLSAARNCGARVARGQLIVFTDDDCRLSPTYIAEALKYEASDNGLVMRSGAVVLGDPDDLPITIKTVTAMKQWKKPMSVKDEGDLLGGSLIGCNMVMRREVLDKLGTFDENLGAGTLCPAAEDTDYFYRAYLAGVTLELVPDLVIVHYHGRKRESDRTSLLKNYGVGNAALAVKYLFTYPNFSRHLVWDIKNCISVMLGKKTNVVVAQWLSPWERIKCMVKGMVFYTYLRTAGLFK